jgi:hypothetical protein
MSGDCIPGERGSHVALWKLLTSAGTSTVRGLPLLTPRTA